MTEYLEPARRSAHILLDALLGADLSRELQDPDGHAIVLALIELNQVGAVRVITDGEERHVDITMLVGGALTAMTGLLAGIDDLDNPVTLEQIIADAREHIDRATGGPEAVRG